MRDSRFIPLARGTRDRSEIPDPIQTVYPRWRGELSTLSITTDREPGLSPLGGELSVFGITFGFGCGLSPLARGTLRERIAARLRKWFIPAGAGNSLKVYICS